MATTTATTDERCGDLVLAAEPFVANAYHFGMLLGVDDLETDQAYHRGKSWLHQAWLHGPGGVWGLEVTLRPENREIAIAPGLAVDGRGRELLVDTELCLDIGAWYREPPAELDEQPDGAGEGTVFQVHVVVCADACQSRPVPSIADVCTTAEDDVDTAYSRTRERAHGRLVAGPSQTPTSHFPRLRRLMGLDGTVEPDAEVAADLDAVAARVAHLPVADQCGAALSRMAALDSIGRAPASDATPFPVTDDDACVVLADLTVHLIGSGEDIRLAGPDDPEPSTVDNGVRTAHVDPPTLLELLRCVVEPAASAVPQVIEGSASLVDAEVTFEVTQALNPATVDATPFTASVLEAGGWTTVGVVAGDVDAAVTTVTVTLDSAPTARPVRLVIAGSGPTPILGAAGQPLSGLDTDVGFSPGGRDAVLTFS